MEEMQRYFGVEIWEDVDKVKYIGLELKINRKKNRFKIHLTDYTTNLADIHGVHMEKCKETAQY